MAAGAGKTGPKKVNDRSTGDQVEERISIEGADDGAPHERSTAVNLSQTIQAIQKTLVRNSPAYAAIRRRFHDPQGFLPVPSQSPQPFQPLFS